MSARKAADGRPLRPALTRAVWAPTAAGAAIGVLSVCFSTRRSGASVAVGGLIGSALGFGGGVAWASRGFTRDVARRAIRNVNVVRDARWLEKNPIAYA
jgi:hypothetical protein